MNYDHFKGMAKPMDLFLCAGQGKYPRLIRGTNFVTRKPKEARHITHIAGGHHDNQIEEATIFNEWAGKRGYQINPAGLWLQQYPGHVWRCRYLLPFYDDMIDAENDFATDHQGRPYESGVLGALDLIKAGIGIKGILPPTNALHCSETKTKKAKYFCILPANIPDMIFAPADMWPGGAFQRAACKHMGLVKVWGPAVQIK